MVCLSLPEVAVCRRSVWTTVPITVLERECNSRCNSSHFRDDAMPAGAGEERKEHRKWRGKANLREAREEEGEEDEEQCTELHHSVAHVSSSPVAVCM